MSRVAEIEARIEEMNATYEGCDWCCGGGDAEMADLQAELLELLPYRIEMVGPDGFEPVQIDNCSLVMVNEHIRNLQPNYGLNVYTRHIIEQYVGGAYVTADGLRNVSFLKK